MFTEKRKLRENPIEILIRCLGNDDSSEWNAWRNHNQRGHISLKDADLGNVNLVGADLSKVNLEMVDLKEVNLAGADLSEANLAGADLSHANSIGADLKAARFISVVVDRGRFIWGCDFDEQTVFSEPLAESPAACRGEFHSFSDHFGVRLRS